MLSSELDPSIRHRYAVTEVTDPGLTHSVKWNIYEIVGWDVDGQPGTYLYRKSLGSEDVTEDIAEAPVWASLEIKWDGCSHLYLKDAGYFHVCGFEEWDKFSRLVEHLFTTSKLKMEAAGVGVQSDRFPKMEWV